MNKRALVLNCPCDICDMDYALLCAESAIEEKRNFHIVTINPEMIMYAQENKDFFEIINNSNLNIIDGIGIKIALKFQNINAENIRGVDFSRELLKLAEKNNYPAALLGAKEEVIQHAVENFLSEYKNLNIVYSRNGYFENDDEIIEEIKAKQPSVVLVGLGSPKQEEMIVKLKQVLNGAVMVGVGGSFDVFSGLTKESPKIFQKLGLEWLYRTICEPKRLKRIFPALPLFLLKCIIDVRKKKD